jgi:hypothetical protein
MTLILAALVSLVHGTTLLALARVALAGIAIAHRALVQAGLAQAAVTAALAGLAVTAALVRRAGIKHVNHCRVFNGMRRCSYCRFIDLHWLQSR